MKEKKECEIKKTGNEEIAIQETVLELADVRTPEFQAAYAHLADLVSKATDFKKMVDSRIREELEKEYNETGDGRIANDDFTIVYVGRGVRESFDSKALKQDDPDTYIKYVKKSIVSASIRYIKKK